MIKKLMMGLVFCMQLNGAINAQSYSQEAALVSAVSGYSLHESQELVQRVTMYVDELKQHGMTDEQILKALEQKLITDPALVSAGIVVKGVLGLIGVVVTAGAIGLCFGIVLGAVGNELEADMRREHIYNMRHRNMRF